MQTIVGQFHLTACFQREEHQPIVIAPLPLFPESGVSVPVKLILRDFFRGTGIVEPLYAFCKIQNLVLIFPKGHDFFLPRGEDKPDGIAFMDGGPIRSCIASADSNFSQVIIGNKSMPTAGDHLNIILCHPLVVGERFQQIQSSSADSTRIFKNGIAKLYRNMTMQAKILRVISCATDPLKVVGFYSENTHVDTPLTTKQRQPIAAAAVAA